MISSQADALEDIASSENAFLVYNILADGTRFECKVDGLPLGTYEVMAEFRPDFLRLTTMRCDDVIEHLRVP